MFERIGKINSTTLGFEHGCLSFHLMFDFGGTAQGFGGYVLDSYDKKLRGRNNGN